MFELPAALSCCAHLRGDRSLGRRHQVSPVGTEPCFGEQSPLLPIGRAAIAP